MIPCAGHKADPTPSPPHPTCARHTGWTIAPGRKMTKQAGGMHTITVEGSQMEFVMTNGNDWDTPNPYSNHGQPNNYVVKTPGSYRLKSGKVEKA